MFSFSFVFMLSQTPSYLEMYEMKYAQKWKSKVHLTSCKHGGMALQGLDRKKKKQTGLTAKVKAFANASNKARTLQVGLTSYAIPLICEGSLSTS